MEKQNIRIKLRAYDNKVLDQSTEEIVNTVKEIIEDDIDSKNVTEDLFDKYINKNKVPDPDLIIRTGGEFRVSNFLLWQISYAELNFQKVLWPDFKKNHFLNAIIEYQKRTRRFGKIES